ncbi:cytoplasmic chaperone TorD family protein [Desulfitobacterium hafniense DCB-2]|uniref:Cytoplasmic chaperone TorD family protein n=1 Tax=Desulfitobacterium hafniense (strain DSM 10664 / DCB-2) TaxID=272564 RepID=B8FPF3_DESHD|nr:molecular chaperone TorD family protein [Desulfitobacterium hafniense]ACL19678.1 cytoplasmic chaperone TorD family protein [Desulfitobacterium hafniense DCB-2]
MMYSWTEVWKLRTELYKFLGNCLLEPLAASTANTLDGEIRENFPLEPANRQMESGLEQLRKCTADLKTIPPNEARQEVMVEYTILFLGPGRPKAPPWESVYRTEGQLLFSRATYEVRKILADNGLEMVEKNHQPEDHIGIELLALALMSENVQDVQERKEQKTRIGRQASFIDEHLLSWIPGLAQDAKQHGSLGYYGGLIELIWGILLWDRELLQEFLTQDEDLADILV